jgi:MscS family membrane protein
MKSVLSSIIFSLFILASGAVNAYQLTGLIQKDSTEAKQVEMPADPLGRTTPRGSVNGFFKSIAADDYVRASQFIDFSKTEVMGKDSLMISYVQKFETLLDKYGYILPVSIISDNPDGALDDKLPLNLESIGSLALDEVNQPLYLELDTSSDPSLWLISSQSIETVMTFIDANESIFSTANTSTVLSNRWKGAPIFHWLAIIVLAIVSYFMAWLITFLIRWVIRLSWKNFKLLKYHRFLQSLLIPLSLVIAVTILLNLSRWIGLSIVVRQAFGVVNLIVIWIALFMFIWLLIDALSNFGEERLRENNSYAGLSAISFFKNSAKFSLIVIALLIGFDTIGFNVTAGIAALGVGGIALALGAQKTVENVVGGLSVVFDQPVSVGDFCRFGDTLGTVEKIGMRSTRIRTLGRTVVTIPNADFSSQLIENYAKRDLFLFHTTLGLRYETSSDQMRYILVELRKILYAHPKVNPDPARVRFLGYGSDSLKVEIFAYIHAVDWNDFLGIQEDINLRIARVIEDSGSGFAFPSQTIYLSKDQGLSETRKAEAEAKVQDWIKSGELNLPEFDKGAIDNLRNSLDYPQKPGSD